MAVDHRFAYIQKWITPKSWTLVELDLEKYLKDEPLSGKSTPYTSPNEEDIEEFMNIDVLIFYDRPKETVPKLENTKMSCSPSKELTRLESEGEESGTDDDEFSLILTKKHQMKSQRNPMWTTPK
uniref:Anaphase-promoting complex subunit 13 n=1 Tax=Caenorhabditis tropicalis TaxID=1561998 RepID=A0A1I7UP69_9PELO